VNATNGINAMANPWTWNFGAIAADSEGIVSENSDEFIIVSENDNAQKIGSENE
jgi:hypothetical protein